MNKNTVENTDSFLLRHLGPCVKDVEEMLSLIGVRSLDDLVSSTVPQTIRMARSLQLGPGRSEVEVLNQLRGIASKNEIYRSFIGMGYSNCVTPSDRKSTRLNSSH